MTLTKFNFMYNECTVWLPLEDAYMCSELAKNFSKILEIGVYKGGWLFTVKDNNLSIEAHGIDPYPNLDSVKEKFLADCDKKNYEKPIQLYPDWKEFIKNHSQNHKYQLIHIDGEHSETAVAKDLDYALKCWDTSGVIVVDDIFSQPHPGVTSATFKFIEKNKLKCFLLTEKKLYISHYDHYLKYFNLTKNLLQRSGIKHLKDHEGSNYPQNTTIDGSAVIIKLPNNLMDEFNYAKNLQVKLPIKVKFKRILKFLTPPIIIFWKQNVKNTIFYNSKL